MSKPQRPILRYPGGKWKISTWIINNLPPHSQYVEPYGGAGSVLLRKPRVRHEVYNDLSWEVVNVFRVMQSPIRAKLLLWKLRYTPFARVEYVLSRKKTRNKIIQAQRTIMRTFMAFGGTGAYNNTTGFKAKSLYEHRSVGAQWIDLSWQLEVFIERLQGVVIENRPALKVIAQQDHEKTLFYVDPPYVKSTRYHENIYDHEMTDEQHIELAKALHNIEGMVVLSGYHSNLYDELYKDWKTKEKEAIIASPSGNNRRTEVLWFNPACSRNKYPLFRQGA